MADRNGQDRDIEALVAAMFGHDSRSMVAMRPGMQLQHHPGFKADVVPFRLDHGHELLTDIGRDTHPGHPLVGRLRGLAELRGLIAGLSYRHPNL